jgi:hypothetical protein
VSNVLDTYKSWHAIVNATAASQAVPVFVGFVRLDAAAGVVIVVGVQLVLLHLRVYCDLSRSRCHADELELVAHHLPA